MFLSRLKRLGGDEVQTYGLDLSARMVEIARERVPDLTAAVGDADLDLHSPGESFDLVCTHFVTALVPMSVLAPKITPASRRGDAGRSSRTRPGSGAAKEGRREARPLALRQGQAGCGRHRLQPGGARRGRADTQTDGFTVLECETFTPRLYFKNLDQFLESPTAAAG